jgi:hypothetical protein
MEAVTVYHAAGRDIAEGLVLHQHCCVAWNLAQAETMK